MDNVKKLPFFDVIMMANVIFYPIFDVIMMANVKKKVLIQDG